MNGRTLSPKSSPTRKKPTPNFGSFTELLGRCFLIDSLNRIKPNVQQFPVPRDSIDRLKLLFFRFAGGKRARTDDATLPK